nr:integrase, catalytic region, zinc finger, CCHC-type, peptidase aspartic, catalytic [Tanacetum cinerariifolium]
EIGSSDGLQPKKADLSDVHALNELHLHEIHVVPSPWRLYDCLPMHRPLEEDDCQHPKESLCQQESSLRNMYAKRLHCDQAVIESNCGCYEKCLHSVNHDVCLKNYVNGKKSRGRKHKANVSKNETQQKYQPEIKKSKNVETHKSLATPKPRKPRFLLSQMVSKFYFFAWQVIPIYLWCVDSGCSKHMTGNLKLLINFVWKFMGIVRFGNDHVAAILGFGDLQWGNILITRVYLVEGLGHNLFSVGLSKFKYHKEHLCPSCEQGKSKRASHPPKPVPNSRQRLHLLHMDLCGPMRIASINGKRKLDISFLHVFGALCYPKNDRKDIGKLGAKEGRTVSV